MKGRKDGDKKEERKEERMDRDQGGRVKEWKDGNQE